MTFVPVEGIDGGQINVADIVSLRPVREPSPVQGVEFTTTAAVLRGGREVRLASSIERITNAGYPVIPAQPRFVLFVVRRTEDDFLLTEKEPIIGWRITPDGPEPIVVGDFRGAYETAIQYPDGHVVDSRSLTHANEGEWHMILGNPPHCYDHVIKRR